MVQIGYPYAVASNNLPGWPTKVACDAAKTFPTASADVEESDVSIFNTTNIEALARAWKVATKAGSKNTDDKTICVNFDGSGSVVEEAFTPKVDEIPYGWYV